MPILMRRCRGIFAAAEPTKEFAALFIVRLKLPDEVNQEGAIAMKDVLLSRRDIVIATSVVGGGMVLGIVPLADTRARAAAAIPVEFDPWLVIAPDDTITVRYCRSEMGARSLDRFFRCW